MNGDDAGAERREDGEIVPKEVNDEVGRKRTTVTDDAGQRGSGPHGGHRQHGPEREAPVGTDARVRTLELVPGGQTVL